MRITNETIDRAFRAHGRVYASQREWAIADHARCWVRAAAAFDGASFPDFEWLHGELKNRWQVFRSPSGTAPTAQETWGRVGRLNPSWSGGRLSQMNDDNIAGCWDLINSVSDIKPMKGAPSVVAISKFLHFWNPRLFIIVDDAVMWVRVLSRSWLEAPIERERKRLQAVLPDATCPRSESCDLLSYLAVLSWAATLVRDHPAIPISFDRYIRSNADGCAASLPLVEYEAAAVEWLLLGLAELPPEGVDPG